MKKLVITLCALTLTACSTSFTYNNLDWLVYWYLDDYVELTDEQKQKVDPKLNEWLVWHREHELTLYLAHFAELSQDIQNKSLNSQTLDKHQALFEQHWQRLKARIVPDLVALAPLLSQQQIDQMFDVLGQENTVAKQDHNRLLTRNKIQQENLWLAERTKRLSRWLGPLSNSQRQLLEQSYQQYQDTQGLWIDFKMHYQHTLKHHLLVYSQVQTQAQSRALERLLLNPDTLKEPILVNKSQANVAMFKGLVQDLNQNITTKQREHLIEELAGIAQDIEAILN
ncbi:DUF6279 family lipoprotein [Motilimonas pumila]|uniref:Lipoprotein n=1 Tax=Motilimonas pumila TaxID=2303987 RepID=A0A418YG18_9GAMM|nr:DUF6279 family lipoprotein [Motilimonas pumila]RJG48204.1 hypothetical protein D1Z90_09055 [Motilimonas pumila]